MSYEPYFEALGFSEREQRVYLCISEIGRGSASVIARRLSYPRSTVYTVLESLRVRGLVHSEHTSKQAVYYTAQPSALRRMVEVERAKELNVFERKLSAAEKLVEVLQPKKKRGKYEIPKLQFYEGPVHVRNLLFERCDMWQASLHSERSTWWGYQDHHFVEEYSDWIDHHAGNMLSHEHVRLFSNHSETESRLKGKIDRREVRLLPDGYEFSSTIWVIGDYVVTVVVREQPHYAYELKDPIFAENQRTLFRWLWSLSESN